MGVAPHSSTWSHFSGYLDLFSGLIGVSHPSGISLHPVVHGARQREVATLFRPLLLRGLWWKPAPGLRRRGQRWSSRPESRSLPGIAIAGDSGRKRGRFLLPSCGLESGIFRTWSRPRTCSSDTTRAPRLWHVWRIACGQVSATWRICLSLRTAHGASNGARRAPSFAPCAAGRSILSRSRSRATLQQRLNRPGRVHKAGIRRDVCLRRGRGTSLLAGQARAETRARARAKARMWARTANRAKAIHRSRLESCRRHYLPCRRRPRSLLCPKLPPHRRSRTQLLRMRR